MWNRPHLMKDVADLLFTAGAAVWLVVLVVAAARLPLFPIREIVVNNELHEVRGVEIQRAMSEGLHGNFFSVSLESLRQSLEQLSWVRRAELRRRWPAAIEVNIEEQVPVAFWGQTGGQLVNSHGEIFTATTDVPAQESLPLLVGPTSFAPEMLGYYRQAVDLLHPLGRFPSVLNVSPRLAVQLKLDDGMIVELGRQQAKAPVKERLERFVEFYPSILTVARKRPEVVDMRYPNGFALKVNGLAGASAAEEKGKP